MEDLAMRRLLVATLLLLGLGLGVENSAQAQARQDFTLINRTGYTIDQVFVSPSNQRSWGRDVLGQDILESGQQVSITFPRAATACQWDLKVVYNDGDQTEWIGRNGFNLCQISRITLYWNRQQNTTRAETE
jgi:hypothetical protein